MFILQLLVANGFLVDTLFLLVGDVKYYFRYIAQVHYVEGLFIISLEFLHNFNLKCFIDSCNDITYEILVVSV